MRRILCYGDSNTWGFVPSSDRDRYPVSIRYPRVLASLLGDEYEVIEEGLPGRTVLLDDEVINVGNRNGSLVFGQIVYSHLPLDYVLILLGSNDLKPPVKGRVKQCVDALENIYLDMINKKLGGRMKGIPKVIIVAPSIVGSGGIMDEDTIEESKLFNKKYEELAKRNNCLFVSNDGLVTGSDDIHLTVESHKLLARKIYEMIKEYESR